MIDCRCPCALASHMVVVVGANGTLCKKLAYCPFLRGKSDNAWYYTGLHGRYTTGEQEDQLSPRDRAMRRVSWNLASCHATVQKLLSLQGNTLHCSLRQTDNATASSAAADWECLGSVLYHNCGPTVPFVMTTWKVETQAQWNWWKA